MHFENFDFDLKVVIVYSASLTSNRHIVIVHAKVWSMFVRMTRIESVLHQENLFSFQQLSDHFPEGYIPEAPPIPVSDVPDITETLNALGEPTLQSLGLGSYFWPTGWVQNALEFLHVTLDLPWWGCIVTGKNLHVVV